MIILIFSLGTSNSVRTKNVHLITCYRLWKQPDFGSIHLLLEKHLDASLKKSTLKLYSLQHTFNYDSITRFTRLAFLIRFLLFYGKHLLFFRNHYPLIAFWMKRKHAKIILIHFLLRVIKLIKNIFWEGNTYDNLWLRAIWTSQDNIP